MNEAPYEILSGTGKIYRAAVAETFPADPDTAVGGQWNLIGTNGDLNYMDSGIVIAQPQTINVYRPLGSTAPVKAWRSEEDLIIRAVVNDLTLEEYTEIVNRNTITPSDGFAKLGLHRGIDVERCALLIRFNFSPYRDDGTSQFEIPIAVQQGQPEVVFNRGTEPAGLAFEWRAMVDPSASTPAERLGRFKAKLADT